MNCTNERQSVRYSQLTISTVCDIISSKNNKQETLREAGDKQSYRLKAIFKYIQTEYNITLREWNHDYDHVHVLFTGHPDTELTKFLNAYKSAGSRLIKKEYPEIKSKLWNEYFRSRSFCLIST